MRKSNQKRSKNQNRNLLTQLVFCEQCGGGAHFEHTTDTVQTYKKVSGEVVNYRRKTYRRLRCDRSRRKHSCDNPTILNYDVVEKTVLDELLPRLVDQQTESQKLAELREKLAELGRQKDASQARLDNIIDAIADGGGKALVERATALESEVEKQSQTIKDLQKQLAVETAKPSSDDDMVLVESLRAELVSEDDDIRIYARGRVNIALRRLLHRIEITAYHTFIVWSTEDAWWRFDEDGALLDGEQIWRAA
ncbi:zinc ribbon domain-containing protein [Sphingomonas fennica]|nr:recombinase zinc beta ribbon domain-containing protein [Sphingomonas fennica]